MCKNKKRKNMRCRINLESRLEPFGEPFGWLSFEKRILILYHFHNLWLKLEDHLSPTDMWDFRCMSHEQLAKELTRRVEGPAAGMIAAFAPLTPEEELEGYHKVYTATMSHKGDITLKPPRKEKSGSPLQDAFGSEYILRVKVEEESPGRRQDMYRSRIQEGFTLGGREYSYYGKKESDKKSREGAAKESSLVLFFVAISTSSGYDLQLSTSSCPSFKSGMEMHRFMMHAHTCPTIAKMEARMELALSSTTRLDVDMATMTIDEIPDICTEEGGGVHTDGAGFISLDLAKLCPSVMFRGTQLEGARNKKIEEEFPLLLQVRVFRGGDVWKGVLCVNLKLPPNTIQLRPSMHKVKRDESDKGECFMGGIMVCQTSRLPHEARLCSSLISILLYGGVPKSLILELAAEALAKVKEALSSEEGAISVVKAWWDGPGQDRAERVLRLLCAGLHKDRYVQELLNHFLKNRFRDIGEGKIPLGGKSWYLMGAPDPTGQLEEGQCFLAIKGRPQDTHGKVLVYHSPGLHFGDARVLEAVYPRGIEEYIGDGVNAIFFSTKGKRLVTDMMAGGDLDGDMFLVCKHTQVREQLEARVMKKQGSDWSRFTMPQILASFSQSPPYEAGPQPPHPASSPSSTLLCPAVLENDEICRSRCDMALNTLFNKSYAMPKAANAYKHLVDRCFHKATAGVPPVTGVEWCGQWKEAVKPWEGQLEELAGCYYRALDSAKSGEVVKVPPHLIPDLYPSYENPEVAEEHFIRVSTGNTRPHEKKFYRSTSVFGDLFELTDNAQNVAQTPSEDADLIPEFANVEGHLMHVPEWTKHSADAREERARIMQCKLTRGEQIAAFKNLGEHFKQILFGAHTMEASKKNRAEVFAGAAALYKVETGSAKPCLDFLWTVAVVPLCAIKIISDSVISIRNKDPLFVGTEKVPPLLRNKQNKRTRSLDVVRPSSPSG